MIPLRTAIWVKGPRGGKKIVYGRLVVSAVFFKHAEQDPVPGCASYINGPPYTPLNSCYVCKRLGGRPQVRRRESRIGMEEYQVPDETRKLHQLHPYNPYFNPGYLGDDPRCLCNRCARKLERLHKQERDIATIRWQLGRIQKEIYHAKNSHNR